jgi:hypothetical protein
LIGILFVLSALIRGQTVNPDSALQMIVEKLEGYPITLSEAYDLAKKEFNCDRKSRSTLWLQKEI